MKAENLPFADGEFDAATAIEVLEHVPDAEHTVAEMARCAKRRLLVSVPREPLWRGLNIARGAYLEGARQHARPRQPLVQARVRGAAGAPRRGRRGAFAVPVDDVAVRLRHDDLPGADETAGPPQAFVRRGARILSIGIASTGCSRSPILGCEPRSRRRRLRGRLAAVGRAVRRHVGHLPARRAAAVAHDRRPPRARRITGAIRCGSRRSSRAASRRRSWSSRWS